MGIKQGSHKIQYMFIKDHSDRCVENGYREAKWNKETSEEAAGRVHGKMMAAWTREAGMEMERNGKIQGIF